MTREEQKRKMQLHRVRALVREKSPLIHCITNPISIHDCANVILAVGARPIMAEHPGETEEITRVSSALMLNLGNITDARMESTRLSLRTANACGIPVLLDLVGVTCSRLRREYAKELLKTGQFSVLKGNISELLAISGLPYHGTGIDAGAQDAVTDENEREICAAMAEFAAFRDCAVLATGKRDLIAGDGHAYLLENGDPMLSRITGTGCMVGAMTAAYLAGQEALMRPEATEREAALETPGKKTSDFADESDGSAEKRANSAVESDISSIVIKPSCRAAVLGAALMGIAGEEAARRAKGPGSFQAELLDAICEIGEEEFYDRIRLRAVRL